MDCFKKIAKYSFISSNIVSSLAMENKINSSLTIEDKKINSSLAMNKINKNTEYKEVKFNSIKSLGIYMNVEGMFEKKILHDCYLVSDNQEKRDTLINKNVDYLGNVEIKMSYNKYNNNINIKHERLNDIPFFILNFKNKNIEKNFIFNCNLLENNILYYLRNILKEFGENYDIFCLGSNNKDQNIKNIKKGFFSGLGEIKGTINIKNLNSFKYENIMSSFNMTNVKNIILPNNLDTNDFTNIDMNNNIFSNKFYGFARINNLNINEVCEEYYKFSKGVINEDNIKNFVRDLQFCKLLEKYVQKKIKKEKSNCLMKYLIDKKNTK